MVGPRFCRRGREFPSLLAGDLKSRVDSLVKVHGTSAPDPGDGTIHANGAGEVELLANGLRPPGKTRIGHMDVGDADGRASLEQFPNLADIRREHRFRASGFFS